MKALFTIAMVCAGATLFAQNEITVTEQSQFFNAGNKNSIVVTIPNATVEFVTAELKKELRGWGGKYSSSGDEQTELQATMKTMGDKPFDAYAKVISNGNGVKVAVAIDLGGSYLNSTDHRAQYDIMAERLRKFAVRTSDRMVDNKVSNERKVLATLQKDQQKLEKDHAKLLKSIEDYKKKIVEAEAAVRDNTTQQARKKEAIDAQQRKVEQEAGKKL